MRTSLLDSVLELDLPDDVAARLRALLPAAAPDGVTTGEVRLVPVDGGHRLAGAAGAATGGRTARSVHEAVELVLEACNRTALEQCADYAVHAGAVARDGAVLALPGASGAGKTTLVAALLQGGWQYVSDEALVLAPDGVRAYPKWLSVHRWTLARLGLAGPLGGRPERPVAPAELGSLAAGSLHLAHVLLPERRPGAAELREAPRAQAAAELLRFGFNHYRDPAASVATVTAALAQAKAWRLDLDDPVEAAEVIRARLG